MKKIRSTKRFPVYLANALDWAAIFVTLAMILSIFFGMSKIIRGLFSYILHGYYTWEEFRYAVHMPRLQGDIFKWDSGWWFTLFLPVAAYLLSRLLSHFSRVLAFDPSQDELRKQTRIQLIINREERSLAERAEKLGSYRSHSGRD
ncbi:hypothetical protein [Novosphingobium sp.]|uniref:hypothetical protein n=1 Tax=Novosphingobium sp. TaxID=1874826 RepID=UPI003D0FD5F9